MKQIPGFMKLKNFEEERDSEKETSWERMAHCEKCTGEFRREAERRKLGLERSFFRWWVQEAFFPSFIVCPLSSSDTARPFLSGLCLDSFSQALPLGQVLPQFRC